MIEYLVAAAAITALVAAAYAVYQAWRTRSLLEELLEAASLRERIARSLAKTRTKPRQRYIVFEVASTRRVSRDELARTIRETASRVLGMTGIVDSGLQLVEYDESARRGIVRVKHTYKYHALAILGMIRRVGDEEVLVIPVAASGTLRKARKEAKRRAV